MVFYSVMILDCVDSYSRPDRGIRTKGGIFALERQFQGTDAQIAKCVMKPTFTQRTLMPSTALCAILLISPSESLAVRCDTIWKTFCVFNRTWNLLLLWKLLTRPEFSIVEFRLAFFFFSAYKQSAIKSHESLRQFIHEKWKWTLLA